MCWFKWIFSQAFRGWTLDKIFNFYMPSIDYNLVHGTNWDKKSRIWSILVGLSLICLDTVFSLAKSLTYFKLKFPWLLFVYKIPRSLNWNRSLTNLTNWNKMKFLPIHTKRCVHSKFFLHLIMIRCGNVSSKSNMIESCSWDYGPETLLFNTLQEKLNTDLM